MLEQPAIAIIGRPNVGKSTLFNRLTRKRSALVSNIPGLTRDRRVGDANIAGHVVKLIDTAGLERVKVDSISTRMFEQSKHALLEADLILFMIDARTGIMPYDIQLANFTRCANKPSVLVVNKCEGQFYINDFYEAFELGLGNPIAISAEHSIGINKLHIDLLAGLGLKPSQNHLKKSKFQNRELENKTSTADNAKLLKRTTRIAIIGRPNAGKSTLVNTLLGEERMITGPEPGLTRDSIASDFNWQGRHLLLFDTAGLRRKSRIQQVSEKLSSDDSMRAIRFAEVVILIVDAEIPLEHQDLAIADHVIKEGRALVIAINKWDTINNKHIVQKKIHNIIKSRMTQVEGVPVIFISALAESGLDQLMNATLAVHDIWNQRIGTSNLNRWLQEALIQHTPPLSRGRRIRLRYVTQPSARPPTFIIFCSQPEELPKTYKKYLLNNLRATFNLPGTPIRLNIRKGDNPYAKSK
ncbi:MAG: ribosome biogenesis GTPase Der [Hyphomicrobiaceae bacterium]|nr:ribosome biogenesis GTPase Der [Hyphomicrobiaceae bacterium]